MEGAATSRSQAMQNRYVGDIGDYLKLGILRALSPGYQLGVAWWLFPDEAHNRDGRHIGYLRSPERWRHFDPELFDILHDLVLSTERREVRALEQANLLGGASFASNPVPRGGPVGQRETARHDWFANVQRKLEGADLLFLDPDNGFEAAGFRPGTIKSGKSITLNEVCDLARPGRCLVVSATHRSHQSSACLVEPVYLVVYHHQSRRKGGHHAEMEHWRDHLKSKGFTTVDALRARHTRLVFITCLMHPPKCGIALRHYSSTGPG